MQGQPITIRNLGPEDAHVLDRVAEGLFDQTVDPVRAFAVLATRVNELVVALDQGRVIGFLVGTVLMHPSRPTALFVQDVCVAVAYRRRGVASRLMRRVSELAEDRGCEEVWVGIEAEHSAVHAVCRKLEESGVGPRFIYVTKRV